MSDLRGKDYLTEKEAGIRALLHMGKKLYRRSDLSKSIEKHA